MAHALLTNLAAQYPHTQRLRKRQARILRAVRPSKAAECWYRGQLLAITRLLRSAGTALAEDLRPHWPAVHDAIPTPMSDRLRRLAERFGNIKAVADRLAAIAVKMNLGEVDDRLVASIKESIGLDISRKLTDHGPIAVAMREAAEANAALIKSIPEQYFAEIGELVRDAFAGGLRWEELVEHIKSLGYSTDNRAKLIARDQTGKMNSAFNRVRQTGLGIKRYRWSGALDIRERSSHRLMEGAICEWNDPPMVDSERVNPGEPVQCRCVAIPLVNLEEIAARFGGEEEEAA